MRFPPETDLRRIGLISNALKALVGNSELHVLDPYLVEIARTLPDPDLTDPETFSVAAHAMWSDVVYGLLAVAKSVVPTTGRNWQAFFPADVDQTEGGHLAAALVTGWLNGDAAAVTYLWRHAEPEADIAAVRTLFPIVAALIRRFQP